MERRSRGESFGRVTSRLVLAGTLALAGCAGSGGRKGSAEGGSSIDNGTAGLGSPNSISTPSLNSTHSPGVRHNVTPTVTKTKDNSPKTTLPQTPHTSAAARPRLIFDAIVPPPIVEVYSDVSESGRESANGTYNDGDSRFAECKTNGRIVDYVDVLNPRNNRSSDDWIRIKGTPGETQYASAVYTTNAADVLKQIPDC